MPAGVPPPDVAIPAAVRALAGGADVRPVWRNELGGLTFALGRRRFVKWAPAGCGLDLQREAGRLRWAAPFTAVPPVVAEGADADGAWLVTTALAGESAVAPRWQADPGTAVPAIGRGLRRLHDALPVDACPFRDPGVPWLTPSQRGRPAVRAALAELPPVDRLVVCHGDACAPNTLLDAHGEPVGHVDLGELGVADRWADLAVATWNTVWNWGPGWELALLDAYGIDPDPMRTAAYRLLWEPPAPPA